MTTTPSEAANGRAHETDRVGELAPGSDDLAVASILGLIAEHAEAADRTRTIDDAVVAALKSNDLVRLSASSELGGLEASVLSIGRELEAISAACPSTAWVMWNHLAVFHLFVGCYGPDRIDLLRSVVEQNQTVCFPAGAGSGVQGVRVGDSFHLRGKGGWGSGSRYADWAGVAFIVVDEDGKRSEPMDLRFAIVPLDDPTVRIDPTWDGSAMRASATDDIHYEGTVIDADRCVPWFGANRAETLREIPVVSHRYREDWVGLSDVWLAWMGVGLVRRALTEAVDGAKGRRSILGKQMTTHPTVQLNLGEAASLVTAAAGIAETACRQVDERIDAAVVPTEADYLRQMALSTAALDQLSQAMGLIRRALGGTGIQEGGSFDRHHRNFQAMPLHINAHADRVHLRMGRFVLDEAQDPF